MTAGSYSGNSKEIVKTTVEDEEVIEAFISELESSEEASKLLEEAKNSNVLKAYVSYELLHPYDGEDFMTYLALGEEVTARTKFELHYNGRRKLYEGHITQKAIDIFTPEALIDRN